ncbi:hypothetical protein H0H81_000008 [Sphagnurus paluster]|uniref:Uncharacterized protein n=1 Tax=Sphagnurus paluster TaxID=117069 RepID=A0A9P7FX31_9AGAR|nr:hypothetical protein H0H81_000008 [Sphagnurus paluster]
MAQESNAAQPVLSFGPSTEVLTIHVVIEHSEKPGGKFSPSKVIDPVTVRKEPDAYSPLTIIVSTILSEDNVDDDYNDCIVTILQYK